MTPVKPYFPLLALALLALCSSCEPEPHLQWAPDGRRAALLSDSRLYLVDAEGQLSDPLGGEEGANRQLVDRFAWLPDGSSLLVQRVRLEPDWDRFAAGLPPEILDRLERLVPRVPDLLRTAVALRGDADLGELLLGSLLPGEGLFARNLVLRALERDGESVRAALTGSPEALASLEKGDEDDRAGYVFQETLRLPWADPAAAEVLFRDLSMAESLQASPRHPWVARAVKTAAARRFDLELISLEGKPTQVLARGITRAFAWTPDGRSLVLMRPLSPEGEGSLMKLELRPVLDEGGGFLPDESPRELAYALVPFAPRVAVLPDGSVLFASQPGTLPSAPGQPGQGPRLYRLPASGGEPLAIPTAEGALPMDLGYFVPSPDGRQVVVVESATDAVALVDLESGASELVTSPHRGWRTRLLPAWREAGEFTFAALDAEKRRVTWKRWRQGKIRELSQGWPEEILKPWLHYQNPNG